MGSNYSLSPTLSKHLTAGPPYFTWFFCAVVRGLQIIRHRLNDNGQDVSMQRYHVLGGGLQRFADTDTPASGKKLRGMISMAFK